MTNHPAALAARAASPVDAASTISAGAPPGAAASPVSAEAPPGAGDPPASAGELPVAAGGPHTAGRPPAASRDISRAIRRRVAERDNLRCTWTDAEGRRCGSRAWLEHDHQIAHADGGASDEQNVRLLCRAHNRLEAERRFGRNQIERAIAHARRARDRKAAANGSAAP